MSNWVAAEWGKFKAWVESHAKTTNSRLDALETRVTALEGKKADAPRTAPEV